MESWCQPVVVVYVEKQYLAGVENLTQSPACGIDPKETPATKAADATVPQGDICSLAILKSFLNPRRNHSSTYWHVLPIVTQKTKGRFHLASSYKFQNGINNPSNKIQGND